MSPVMMITGGHGLLGGAVAERAETAGFQVVRTGRTQRDGAVRHDVTSAESWASAIDTVLGQHGRLDVLVNAAGGLGGSDQTVTSARVEQWHELLDAHVIGAWLGCREIVSRSWDRPVAIVNIASTAGICATPGMVAYGAMKAAVVHLTKSVALHCARGGMSVRCNAVAPALVDGGLRDDVLDTMSADRDSALTGYLSRVPTQRLVHPAEIAASVLHLADPTMTSLTGETVTVSGGLGLA